MDNIQDNIVNIIYLGISNFSFMLLNKGNNNVG